MGYGGQFAMGKHHADNVRKTDGLVLKGVFDVDPARRDAAKTEQPDVVVYDTFEALLDSADIGLVVLITPHDTHAPLSIAASNAGKHVLTEKVMCLNVAECDAMIAAAKKTGKCLSVYQNRRLDGDYLTVKKQIESGTLGNLFSIESSVNGYWFPAGWRGVKKSGGGMLYDWGAHLTDQLVQLMLPVRPVSVYANFHYGGHDVDVETQTTVSIRFDNGVMAQIDVGCVSWLTRPRWLVRGEKAAVLMPDWETCTLRGMLNGSEQQMSIPVEASAWERFYPALSAHLNDGAPLPVDPTEVRIALSVIDAAFESGRTGRSVEIAP